MKDHQAQFNSPASLGEEKITDLGTDQLFEFLSHERPEVPESHNSQ